MRTVDRTTVHAPIDRVFTVAAEVERWPEFLEHYRWVRVLEHRHSGGLVEMAARRSFGPVKYPTWWVSEMDVLPARHVVRYRHVRGVTRGMDVEWKLTQQGHAVNVTVVHQWAGPQWPLIGAITAEWVIGPVFIHHIASRTLAGVKRRAEGR